MKIDSHEDSHEAYQRNNSTTESMQEDSKVKMIKNLYFKIRMERAIKMKTVIRGLLS